MDIKNLITNNAILALLLEQQEIEQVKQEVGLVPGEDGYETHAGKFYTSADVITLRENADFGLGSTSFTGLVAKKYDGINDGQLVFDADGYARVGDKGSLQMIATREDAPLSNGIAFYDNDTRKFKTKAESTLSVAQSVNANKLDNIESFRYLRNDINNPKLRVSGGLTFTLEADSDNSNESDNVSFILSQDGGGTTATLGLNSSNDLYLNHGSKQVFKYDEGNEDVIFNSSIHSSAKFNKTVLYSPESTTDIMNIRRYGKDHTVLNVWSPPQEAWGGAKESTLSLVRGNLNEYFMDIYNMDYGLSDHGNYLDYGKPEMGIRLQKRGSGTYTPFYIEYGDGTKEFKAITILPNGTDTVNHTSVELNRLIANYDGNRKFETTSEGTKTTGTHTISNNNGLGEIGCKNSSWFHFETDRPAFYFNKSIHATDRFAVYGTNTYLANGMLKLNSNDWIKHTDAVNEGWEIVTDGTKDFEILRNIGIISHRDTTFKGTIGTAPFISGIGGKGTWRISQNANAEFDNLDLREGLTCNTFTNNKINISNGDLIVSDTDTIEYVDSNILYFSKEQPFRVGDILRCQGSSSPGNIKSYYITVESEGTSQSRTDDEGELMKYITFTGKTGSGTIEIGDILLRWNSSDTDRKGLLYLSSSSTYAPFYDVIYNGKTKARFGRLDGITSSTGKVLSGYGLWAQNGYFEGWLNAKEGLIANCTINSDSVSTPGWTLHSNGSGNLANGAIVWDKDGKTTLGSGVTLQWEHLSAESKANLAGPQGVKGDPGNDGVTTYTWIKYADSASGSGLSNSPIGKEYIGFAYNKTSATESNNAADYSWSLVKGDKGDTGVKGDSGADGVTTYTWIKYSDSADGTNLYDIPNSNTLYIGIATNKTSSTESTNKADYKWSLFKGDKGAKGDKGDPGTNGVNGQDGRDGKDAPVLYAWSGSTSVPTNTNYAGGSKYTFTSEWGGKASIWIKGYDFEGGIHAGLNNSDLGAMSAPDVVTRWFKFDATLNVGSNEISIWSVSGDAGSTKEIIVKAEPINNTYIDATGLYTGTIHANKISAGTIHADRIGIASIGASKIKTQELEVGTNIAMGPNATISWSKVSSKPDVETKSGAQNKADQAKSEATAKTEGGVTTINQVEGGNFSINSSNQVGAIKIRLPQSWTNSMLKIVVDIYNYSTGKSFTAELAGYNYASSSNWVNCTASIIGTINHTIRFGHDGSKCCIYIGDTNTRWDYPKVTIRSVQVGYSQYEISKWQNGWNVSLQTTLSSNIDHTVTNALLQKDAKDRANSAYSLAGTKITSAQATQITKDTVTAPYINGLTCTFNKGSIGGWKINSSAMYSGTYQGSNAFTSSGITIHKNGAIRAKNFRIDTNGNAYFKGDITGASGTFSGALTATSGTIGGWKINSSAMYSGTYQGSNAYTSSGITIHKDGAIRAKNFRIDTDGNAYFKGEIESTSGTIGDFRISGSGIACTDDSRAYVITRNSTGTLDARIGSSVFPASSGASGVGYFCNTEKNDFSTNYGLVVKASNSGSYGKAIALDVIGDIRASGDISANSDRILKKNIKPTINASDRITLLNPVTFNWKKGNDKRIKYGFIAQEVEEVYPDLVNTADNGVKSVNYIGLISELVATVQELKHELKQLQNDITN